MVLADIYIILKKWWNAWNINTERDKRTNLVQNITDDLILLAWLIIGLGITGVGLLSAIVVAPAVIGIETVSIVMGLRRVVGNQAIRKLSLKTENMKRLRC